MNFILVAFLHAADILVSALLTGALIELWSRTEKWRSRTMPCDEGVHEKMYFILGLSSLFGMIMAAFGTFSGMTILCCAGPFGTLVLLIVYYLAVFVEHNCSRSASQNAGGR
jgi:hypothetical protein